MTRLLITLLTVALLAAPATRASYEISEDSLRSHESVLAHDSLEGRRVGEIGEWKAAQYIQAVFAAAGLQPTDPDDSWLQEFEFVKTIEFGDSNRLILNGTPLSLSDEFVPMKQSASVAFDFDTIIDVGYGITVDEDDGSYDDYEGLDIAGKAVLIRRYAPPEDENPHVDFEPYQSLTSKINSALMNDAAGIFFITPGSHDDTLQPIGPVRITPKDIPIVFLRRAALDRLDLSLGNPQLASAEGVVELLKVHDTGYNVLGHLPGETDTTIVIGAHYDHLGYGGPGSGSRYLGNDLQIHNGADDNGSGTSVLLELARYYGSRPESLRYSLLFAAFSGEEFGILGSNHFAKNMTVDSSTIRMMINMDMVGRLADQENGLAVMGTGTTEAFTAYFDSLDRDDVQITQKKSGQGPSDHTAFYNRGIPVLMFFTGPHNDYHKPEDDIDKIDFPGLVTVADVVSDVVSYFDTYDGPMTFQKTKGPGPGAHTSSFSVTLGIMPDYIAEVDGLRVDNVQPDRPGERAGLLDGDIITRMGEIDIGDIYDYMNALGRFRKGDTTVVRVNRNDQDVDLTVIFK